MWKLILLLFVVVKASAVEIDCDVDFFDTCPYPELFDRIPREVEEFNALCPQLSTYEKCWRDYDMKCQKEMDNPLESYANSIIFYDEICEEGSNLNKIATTNLKCFNETFSNTYCEEERKAFLKPFEEEVLIDEFTTSHTIPERVHCLSSILFAECIASDITKNCGIEAQLATLEFYHRTSFLDGSCPLSYRKTLLDDIDEFSLTENQKIFVVAELERMRLNDK